MKKYLSLLLAIMMVLSTVSFAAPAMTGVVNSASEETETVPEAIETEAELSAQENLGQLIAKVDFENIEVGTKYEYTSIASKPNLNNMGYIADNLPEGFPENIVLDLYDHTSVSVAEDESGNKYGKYVLGEKAGFSKLGLTAANASQTSEASFPAGSYTFKISLTAVSKTALDETVTNYTSPEGCSAIAFFKNNSGVTFNNERYTDLASPGTSRGMISSNLTSGTTTKIKGTITYTDSCDVQFRSTQPKFKFAGFTTFHSMISFNANSAKERVYYVDDIELYYKPVAEVVDINFYDVRKGYIDITVNKALPEIKTIADANKAFIKSNTSTLFDAGLDIITNEDGTVTYRLYENDFLANRTVNLNTVYQSPDYGVLILKPGETATYSYTALDMKNYDGENMMANGDFSNPYYIGVVKANDNSGVKITEDGLVTTMEKTATPNNNMQLQAVPFTLGKYFIEFEMNHLTNSITPIDGSSYSVSLYMPFPNNDGSYSIGTSHYSNPAHIPSATVGSGFTVDANKLKNNTKHTIVNRRVLDLSDASKITNNKGALIPIETFATYPFCFQVCPKGTYLYKTPDGNKTNADGTPVMKDACYGDKVEGLSFAVKYFSVKKMFEASFTDGTTTEKLDIVKDVEFILPVKLGDKNVAAWFDENGNKYVAGALYTPKEYVEEGISFTAVYEFDSINEQKTSIRTDEHSGVRFLASVTKEQKEKLDEYGFVVTRKVILDKNNLDNDDLAFDAGFPVVNGKAYSKEENIDKIYDTNSISVFFTGVVTGIPEEMYEDQIVVRPYTKKDGVYYYGETTQTSVLDVIKKIRDGGYSDTVVTEEQKAFCKQVLIKYGEYTEETDEGYVIFEDDAENGNWFGMEKGYNCTLDLVEDPEDSTNHAYYITNRPDVENSSNGLYSYIWSSASYKFTVEENAIYKFTCDVYVTDKDMNGNTIQKVAMSGAFDFNGKSKGFSGIINATVNPCDWTGVEKVGKLCYTGTDTNINNNWAMPDPNANPAPADTNSGLASPKAKFGIYSNPVNNVGVSFYVDNIKLIKLK